MKKLSLSIVALTTMTVACKMGNEPVTRPKMVVGIVVDQMRWDYLYRFYERYGHSGFRRLLQDGYSCNNTTINYLPTYTAPGHACIYTGSIPAIHGIAGNDWVDKSGNRMYCVQDATVTTTEPTKDGPMSPANLLTTTITDELRLATNNMSRVYGISLKDRGSIIPAGHMANGAYWYNDLTGNFISSSYYPNANPNWLKRFNERKVADSLVAMGWYTLFASNTYWQSDADSAAWEGTLAGEKSPVFPHLFDTLTGPRRYGVIKSIPAGNTISMMMAKACIEGEQLGKGQYTDFLALSLSATDYIGHRFAPNSIEIEDTYLRLDRDIADLLLYLDKQYSKDGYLVFLTADHGAAQNANYLTARHILAGSEHGNVKEELNAWLKQIYGVDNLVTFTDNYQIYFDEPLIAKSGKDRESIRANTMSWLQLQPQVAYAIDMENIWRNTVPEPIKTMAVNGYNNQRSGGIQVILQPGWYNSSGHATGTTHGTWNPYDAHIPLIWFGWNIKRGESDAPVNMTDIAPTVASLLHVQMPNGCVGKTIQGLKRH